MVAVPKSGVTPKQARARRAGLLRRLEAKHKEEVRQREGHHCRFVLCPCSLFGLFLEVSHLEHKGMGGDPTGERSRPGGLVLICNWRHKESRYAVDKGNLRCRPLYPSLGTDGPIAWEVNNGLGWMELGHEEVDGRWSIRDAPAGAFVAVLSSELTEHFRK